MTSCAWRSPEYISRNFTTVREVNGSADAFLVVKITTGKTYELRQFHFTVGTSEGMNHAEMLRDPVFAQACLDVVMPHHTIIKELETHWFNSCSIGNSCSINCSKSEANSSSSVRGAEILDNDTAGDISLTVIRKPSNSRASRSSSLKSTLSAVTKKKVSKQSPVLLDDEVQDREFAASCIRNSGNINHNGRLDTADVAACKSTDIINGKSLSGSCPFQRIIDSWVSQIKEDEAPLVCEGEIPLVVNVVLEYLPYTIHRMTTIRKEILEETGCHHRNKKRSIWTAFEMKQYVINIMNAISAVDELYHNASPSGIYTSVTPVTKDESRHQQHAGTSIPTQSMGSLSKSHMSDNFEYRQNKDSALIHNPQVSIARLFNLSKNEDSFHTDIIRSARELCVGNSSQNKNMSPSTRQNRLNYGQRIAAVIAAKTNGGMRSMYEGDLFHRSVSQNLQQLPPGGSASLNGRPCVLSLDKCTIGCKCIKEGSLIAVDFKVMVDAFKHIGVAISMMMNLAYHNYNGCRGPNATTAHAQMIIPHAKDAEINVLLCLPPALENIRTCYPPPMWKGLFDNCGVLSKQHSSHQDEESDSGPKRSYFENATRRTITSISKRQDAILRRGPVPPGDLMMYFFAIVLFDMIRSVELWEVVIDPNNKAWVNLITAPAIGVTTSTGRWFPPSTNGLCDSYLVDHFTHLSNIVLVNSNSRLHLKGSNWDLDEDNHDRESQSISNPHTMSMGGDRQMLLLLHSFLASIFSRFINTEINIDENNEGMKRSLIPSPPRLSPSPRPQGGISDPKTNTGIDTETAITTIQSIRSEMDLYIRLIQYITMSPSAFNCDYSFSQISTFSSMVSDRSNGLFFADLDLQKRKIIGYMAKGDTLREHQRHMGYVSGVEDDKQNRLPCALGKLDYTKQLQIFEFEKCRYKELNQLLSASKSKSYATVATIHSNYTAGDIAVDKKKKFPRTSSDDKKRARCHPKISSKSPLSSDISNKATPKLPHLYSSIYNGHYQSIVVKTVV
eukprot:Tbor_TRINITY_DN5941_c1_g3::TRINITY_DN5941_c1_g3_i2::g.18942::m.18942